MTQQNLNNIAQKGLATHIREGRTPPNAQFVKALQTSWKAFAEHKNVRDCGIQPAMREECHVLKHDLTRLFCAIKTDSGESFTGYQLTKTQSVNQKNDGMFGKNNKN